MDQYSARTTGAGPAPGGEAAAGVYRAQRPDRLDRPEPPGRTEHPGRPQRRPGRGGPAAAVRRLRAAQRPRPRLTGLGAGALTTVVSVMAATVDAYLFGGPGVPFGVVFVAVSVAGALYVRPYDLVAAPVAAPIAFAAAIALTSDSGGAGLAGHVISLFTGLATMTGWLYTGTAAAAVIAGVRALLLPSRRRRSRRCSATGRGRSPH